jgi:hypothetical protein
VTRLRAPRSGLGLQGGPGAAGDSVAAATLRAFSGRSGCEYETGLSDAAAGAEVLPGDPNETPRQFARAVP